MTALNLTHRRALDRAKELLVPAAERLLDEAGVKDISKNDFGESQLRNLLALAAETESPAVVENFIRYQMGRDGRGKNWAHAHEGKRLGHRFLEAFGKEGVIEQAISQIENLDTPELTQLARIELIRYFLGFASRYLKYLNLERPGREEQLEAV